MKFPWNSMKFPWNSHEKCHKISDAHRLRHLLQQGTLARQRWSPRGDGWKFQRLEAVLGVYYVCVYIYTCIYIYIHIYIYIICICMGISIVMGIPKMVGLWRNIPWKWMIYIYIYGGVLKSGYPQNIHFGLGFSLTKTLHIWIPHFRKAPNTCNIYGFGSFPAHLKNAVRKSRPKRNLSHIYIYMYI